MADQTADEQISKPKSLNRDYSRRGCQQSEVAILRAGIAGGARVTCRPGFHGGRGVSLGAFWVGGVSGLAVRDVCVMWGAAGPARRTGA